MDACSLVVVDDDGRRRNGRKAPASPSPLRLQQAPPCAFGRLATPREQTPRSMLTKMLRYALLTPPRKQNKTKMKAAARGLLPSSNSPLSESRPRAPDTFPSHCGASSSLCLPALKGGLRVCVRVSNLGAPLQTPNGLGGEWPLSPFSLRRLARSLARSLRAPFRTAAALAPGDRQPRWILWHPALLSSARPVDRPRVPVVACRSSRGDSIALPCQGLLQHVSL
mmetsp:Transcript_22978/g.48640  ORF Transcript_22978/g.48640 Transcript_22978/m.48640 type:complete len:224 (+) Transcript_22978:2687-3358(+)